jgi:hypothetical protein
MSLAKPPLYSVIMATYDRGAHILPSVRSVLAQSCPDFELLVIGDACPALPKVGLADLGDPRVRVLNLPQRVGSQSGPNNAGIAAARGRYIAYLGHDDLWEPFHLADLARLFDAGPDLDFAIGGCIYHLPHDIPGSLVTGLFDTDAAKHRHFFPPSSIAHKRDVIDRIGPWAPPMAVRAPVDAEFVLRAAAADLRFASTGRVSVHKFAAGHRYLSYLIQESQEQARMLPRLGTGELMQQVADLVAESHRLGTFMIAGHLDYAALEPGDLARQNLQRKGLTRPVTEPLVAPLILSPRESFYALDWQDCPVNGLLWSRQSPRPRVLLPCCGRGRALVFVVLAHDDPAALAALDLRLAGQRLVTHRLRDLPHIDATPAALFATTLALDRRRPSVLDLHLTPEQAPTSSRRGIAIGDLAVIPAVIGTDSRIPVLSQLAARRNCARLDELRRIMSRTGKVSLAIP